MSVYGALRAALAEAGITAEEHPDERLGAFVLDPDEGEIRFRASIDFADREPDPALVRPLLMVAAGMAAHHEDLIRGLAQG